MKQETTIAFDKFVSFCEKGVEGLRQYGADVEVLHITDVILAGKVDGARKGNTEYQTTVNATLAAISAQAVVRQEVAGFITAVRDVLKQKLGSRYCKAWGEVGFLNATLGVPKSAEQLLSLVKSMELYFTAYPAAEVAVLNLTHQRASELHAAYLAAMAVVSAARVVQRNRKVTRDTAMAELRASRQLLYRELRTVLSSNDPRWLEFGFNVPGDVVTPAAPEDFVVTAGLPGHLAASWGRPVGADRYRLFAEVVGVDTKPVPVDTTTKASANLGGMTSGAHVKLYVVAANAAGESVPSAVVEMVVP